MMAVPSNPTQPQTHPNVVFMSITNHSKYGANIESEKAFVFALTSKPTRRLETFTGSLEGDADAAHSAPPAWTAAKKCSTIVESASSHHGSSRNSNEAV